MYQSFKIFHFDFEQKTFYLFQIKIYINFSFFFSGVNNDDI